MYQLLQFSLSNKQQWVKATSIEHKEQYEEGERQYEGDLARDQEYPEKWSNEEAAHHVNYMEDDTAMYAYLKAGTALSSNAPF